MPKRSRASEGKPSSPRLNKKSTSGIQGTPEKALSNDSFRWDNRDPNSLQKKRLEKGGRTLRRHETAAINRTTSSSRGRGSPSNGGSPRKGSPSNGGSARKGSPRAESRSETPAGGLPGGGSPSTRLRRGWSTRTVEFFKACAGGKLAASGSSGTWSRVGSFGAKSEAPIRPFRNSYYTARMNNVRAFLENDPCNKPAEEEDPDNPNRKYHWRRAHAMCSRAVMELQSLPPDLTGRCRHCVRAWCREVQISHWWYGNIYYGFT